MILEHGGKRPRIHASAYVAPNATICGEVTVGAESRVLFGAVLTAESGPVTIGERCIIMENAVIRGVAHQPASLGDHVLVGPHAHLSGCRVEDDVFIATGACIFNCATIRARATVRIRGIVHIRTRIPPGTALPIRRLEEGQLTPTPEVIRHLDLCLGCRACETACPSGVEYGALIAAARPYIERFRPAPARWGRRALAAVLATAALRRAVFAPLRPLGGRAWLGRYARRLRSTWLAYAAAMPGAARAPRLPEVLEP